MTHFNTLIEAHELRAGLQNTSQPVVLDCRAVLGDAAAGPAAWAAGHIAGSVHANLEIDLASAPHSGPGNTGGRHPLPDRAALAATCRQWGISNATQVVSYDDAGGAYAARAWWLLRWLGHANVAVLNGGIGAWSELDGAELVTGDSTVHAATEFIVGEPLTRIATLADVEDAVAAQGDRINSAPQIVTNKDSTTTKTILIDARAQQRFDGDMEPIDPVAGHIPGAACLPHSGNLGTDGRFLSGTKLAQRFQSIGATDDLICYCGSGVTAAHNVLAARHAGLPEPRLYVGSWSEWSADPARPFA